MRLRDGWRHGACGLLFAMAGVLPAHAAGDRATARQALMEGRVDDAVAQLNGILAGNSHDAEAQLLLCRAYYSEEASDLAIAACEAAVSDGGGGNAAVRDWMGRAYGQKAAHALVGAFALARKVRVEFEAAVAADPRSFEAASDLGEFYVEAPGMVGGDVSRALQLADRIAATLPQSAHRTRALAAQKAGDYSTAENEFRAAVGVAGKPNAWVDLADFYAKRKRWDDLAATVRKTEAADPQHDASFLDLASILLEARHQFPDAIRLARLYLMSGVKTDAGPACRAHYVLGKLLEKTGDKSGAQAEFRAAVALASRYEPARKALS